MNIPFVVLFVGCVSSVGGRNLRVGVNHGSQIVGGQPTTIAQYPYQCVLEYQGGFNCGCVILDQTSVITGAFCTEGYLPSDLSVRSGQTEVDQGTRVGVLSTQEHPNFDSGFPGYPHDISIVNVEFMFQEGPRTQPMVFPTSDQSFEWELCDVTGWGRVDGTAQYPTDLRVVKNVQIIPNFDCDRDLFPVAGANIYPTQICMVDNFGGQAAVCHGDAGSAMTCYEGEDAVVAGLASWGVTTTDTATCLSEYPSVYTRISSYEGWLKGESPV